MSTNRSQNLNLHLWEPEDNFLRAEFNENFAALDAAHKDLESAISGAKTSSSSAVSSLRSELTAKINTAQTTADSAKTAAAAAYSPSYKPFVIGSATSSGSTIAVGFRPSFVLLQFKGDTFVISEGLSSSSSVSVQWSYNGFSVSTSSTFQGGSFVYIAFR